MVSWQESLTAIVEVLVDVVVAASCSELVNVWVLASPKVISVVRRLSGRASFIVHLYSLRIARFVSNY